MNACGHNDASEFDTARNPVRRTTILSSLWAKARQRHFLFAALATMSEGRQARLRQAAAGWRPEIKHLASMRVMPGPNAHFHGIGKAAMQCLGPVASNAVGGFVRQL